VCCHASALGEESRWDGKGEMEFCSCSWEEDGYVDGEIGDRQSESEGMFCLDERYFGAEEGGQVVCSGNRVEDLLSVIDLRERVQFAVTP
jgi:hypothetical protein